MNDYGLFGDVNIIEYLPKMLTGESLIKELESTPSYDKEICKKSEAERLMALNDIYQIYVPNSMSIEIYSKLYLGMIRSFQKKCTKSAIRQQNLNMSNVKMNGSCGVIGGSDCFSIIGTSGIGKSTAIGKAVELLSANGIIEIDNPYIKVIPTILVQCPFDCSAKGLLLDILKEVDLQIGTDYFERSVKAKYTIDMLIAKVSQVMLNHVGILIVDEVQNMVHHKAGTQLVSMLTQLINSAGVSICLVGTQEVEVFFSSVNYLARRTIGLKYNSFPYDEYFKAFCEELFKYQYTKNKSYLTDDVIRWLYEHSGGTLALVVTIFHNAQEISILNGTEILDMSALKEAYEQRMSMMQDFITPTIVRNTVPKKKKPFENQLVECEMDEKEISIYEISQIARKQGIDVVPLLKKYIQVEEVAV